ncbi:hypothetical protein BD310DRAFT_506263 [Dichomitus squalens]|uniref:Uncharacterized protein n=1 Tax=Dichomitus squalens TaxID=114155 RepID=A0A4Q9PUB4_9APHY|nr:hypothetical protein BD310DRAFT_506263 [Dichomitus squalens]
MATNTHTGDCAIPPRLELRCNTLCTCQACAQVDPRGQWIPASTAADHRRRERMMGSETYRRGRVRASASRGRGTTLRGVRGRPPAPTRFGADSSLRFDIPLKRVRTPSPVNAQWRDAARESQITGREEVRQDVDYAVEGGLGREGVRVDDWQEMPTATAGNFDGVDSVFAREDAQMRLTSPTTAQSSGPEDTRT